MVAGNTEETALGSARGRFLEGLPRKAIELRGAVALLSATPAAEGPRDDMLRRLNALHASALVFRNEALANALHECIERLDAARAAAAPLAADDLDLLASFVRRLPELRDAEPRELGGKSEDSVEALAAALREVEEELVSELDARASEGGARTLLAAELDAPHAGPADEALDAARLATEQPLFQRVLHLVLLCARNEQGELTALLHAESLRLTMVGSVTELIASVREDAPDLVLANEQLARDGELLSQLRVDRATDFIPVVVYESASDAVRAPLADVDGRVPRPFDADQLLSAIGAATSTLIAPVRPSEIGELTLEQLAQRVAEEVRRGLVDGALEGRAESLAFAGGADVLSATYTAVAELRAAAVRASEGRVRFAPRLGERGPALVALSEPHADGARTGQLFGRRVMLVDEDTAVVLLLANVLRAQGATVHELTDGEQVLAAARSERPDLIIASTRLTQLDAFALSRALAREPLLADVPVLLLPAKEQLRSVSREPGVAVQLQPELAAQVVASAASLLAPRTRIEEQLKLPGDVRGTLEGTGVVALMRSVRRARPDARICIRDAWNLFECELREGRLAQVTRTACDGSFVRNERALPQLIGTRAGRFTVCAADGPMKSSLEGTLDEVLTRGARDLAAQLDAVSGPQLARVAQVVFDDDAYALLVEQTPRPIRRLLERLHGGEEPRKLLQAGLVDAAILEPLLLDMARRGSLRAVAGPGGEDLIAEAAEARANELPTNLASPLSIVPPPPNPVISVLSRAEQAGEPAAWVEARPLPAVPAVEARVEAHKSEAAQLAAATVERLRAREAGTSDAGELAAAAAEARRSRSTLAAWTVALLALGAVAFFVAREQSGTTLPVEALGARRPSAVRDVPAAPQGAPVRGPTLLSVDANGFAVYDGILDRTLPVASHQALLIVEATPLLSGATVWLNDRELGVPPQKIALPEGVHELAIKRGDAMSYRFVTVHPGRTWVLRNP